MYNRLIKGVRVYNNMEDSAVVIMQSIPAGIAEQSIIIEQFHSMETEEHLAVFQLVQDNNQILINGETIEALCTVLREMRINSVQKFFKECED
jgi:hypothetical protein